MNEELQSDNEKLRLTLRDFFEARRECPYCRGVGFTDRLSRRPMACGRCVLDSDGVYRVTTKVIPELSEIEIYFAEQLEEAEARGYQRALVQLKLILSDSARYGYEINKRSPKGR